jgi:hypothetical protein
MDIEETLMRLRHSEITTTAAMRNLKAKGTNL